jgi:hypothetical protein
LRRPKVTGIHCSRGLSTHARVIFLPRRLVCTHYHPLINSLAGMFTRHRGKIAVGPACPAPPGGKTAAARRALHPSRRAPRTAPGRPWEADGRAGRTERSWGTPRGTRHRHPPASVKTLLVPAASHRFIRPPPPRTAAPRGRLARWATHRLPGRTAHQRQGAFQPAGAFATHPHLSRNLTPQTSRAGCWSPPSNVLSRSLVARMVPSRGKS